MSNREKYAPGPAAGAEVRKDGENWTLILVRELRHPRETVWQALTDPAQLSEWAPFDADRNLGAVGPVKLSTVGAPTPQISETTSPPNMPCSSVSRLRAGHRRAHGLEHGRD